MVSPSGLLPVHHTGACKLGPPAGVEADRRPEITVVFTSAESIAAAMRTAVRIACRTGARIKMLVPCAVPFPAPLTSPPVLIDWNENRLRKVAENGGVETVVHVYLCRDRVQTLLRFLTPGSVTVLGGNKGRWWHTPEEKLARKLELAGHEVVLAAPD